MLSHHPVFIDDSLAKSVVVRFAIHVVMVDNHVWRKQHLEWGFLYAEKEIEMLENFERRIPLDASQQLTSGQYEIRDEIHDYKAHTRLVTKH